MFKNKCVHLQIEISDKTANTTIDNIFNMNIIDLLNDKSLKGTERRQVVINMIVANKLTINEVASLADSINENRQLQCWKP